MRPAFLFTLAATVLISPALCIVTVDFFPDSDTDCSGDPSKSTEQDPGSDQYVCFSLSGSGYLQVTGDDLMTCGPFYGDSACHQALPDSESFPCTTGCVAYDNGYLGVEVEL